MDRPVKRRSFVRAWAWTALRGGGALVLVAVAWFAGRAAFDMYGRFAEASEAASNAQTQLTRLEGQHTILKASVGSFSSPRGVEAQIRERYGLSRPGEGAINIIRTNQGEASTTPEESGNILRRIFDALFVR